MAKVAERRDTPFEWGTQDCAMFTADMVEAMTGMDLAGEHRGRYKTALGAKRYAAKFGDGGLTKVLDAKLDRVEKAFVQRGDVVLFSGDQGPTLGIYFNGGIFSAGPEGSVFLDEAYDKIQIVWRT